MSGANKPIELNFKENFASIDKDGDGLITRDDLIAHLKALDEPPTESQLGRLMSEVVTDDNGMIDYAAFLAITTKQIRYAELVDEVKNIFAMLDHDGDGFITPDELRRMMPMVNENASDQEVEDMIKVADIDGDGRVSLDEFVQMLTK